MKPCHALAALLLASLCSCTSAGPPANQPPDLGSGPGAGADGAAPDLPPGEALIRVRYPAGGRSLALRGDGAGLSWEAGRPLSALGGDTFEARLPLSAPLQFKPLLDDRLWAIGPNYVVRPGQVLEIYPHFQTERGTWSRRWPDFASKILGNTRGVWVYLPPSYAENPYGRFPVLYMHDGQNLFDPRAAFGGVTWQVAEALDRGAAALDPAQALPQVIVIGPENAGARRIYEYTPTEGGLGGGGGDLYLRFLAEELKPHVDRELRTQPDGAQTALLGSSLGGLISAYAGLTHPAIFGRIGAMSPSTWWDERYILSAVARRAGQPPRPALVYVDSGDSGPSRDDVDNTRQLAQTYRMAGYRDGVDFLHVVQPGALHSEAYWASRLPAALRFLLQANQ